MKINTIKLLCSTGDLEVRGDLLWGGNANPETIKEWHFDNDVAAEKAKAEAVDELKKHRCRYQKTKGFANNSFIKGEEWGLEYCETDEDGEFIDGSDFDIAEVEE